MMQLPHNHHSDHENNISAHIPESYDFKSVSDIFKLLGDYNRIKILWLLYHTEECVINIAAMMNMSSPAASHHLKILKSAGLIEGRKEGKEMYYKASDTPESASLHFMIEEMMKISCPHADSKIDIHKEILSNYKNLSPGKCSSCSEDSFMCPECIPDNDMLISTIHRYLTENLNRHISIEELSAQFHINTTSLKKLFKEAYGKPIASYMKEYRMKRAEQLLTGTLLESGEIADSVGYTNHSKFSAAFREYSGMLPAQYRKAHTGH